MILSVVIPAYNEEKNIVKCLDELRLVVRDKYHIPYEIVVVDDNSQDGTEAVIREEMERDPNIRIVKRRPPGGFGRAVRSGLEAVSGDVVVIYMADLSDDPEDVVAYYRKIAEGYDCVYGSRFIKGSKVVNYPIVKRIVNRIVNKCIQYMFWTRFNDLTNAFKAYRTAVIRDCGPYRASHFNLTLEMSLGALIRRYNIIQIPIRWYGRTWGSSNLRLWQMGRRYLSTLLMLFFQRMLVADDLFAERLSSNVTYHNDIAALDTRLAKLERKIEALTAIGTAAELGQERPHVDGLEPPGGRMTNA
jgi:dolichol-phosphate mannosyltransferase